MRLDTVTLHGNGVSRGPCVSSRKWLIINTSEWQWFKYVTDDKDIEIDGGDNILCSFLVIDILAILLGDWRPTCLGALSWLPSGSLDHSGINYPVPCLSFAKNSGHAYSCSAMKRVSYVYCGGLCASALGAWPCEWHLEVQEYSASLVDTQKVVDCHVKGKQRVVLSGL